VDFILKKILFASPPFTLAHCVGPTPPPRLKSYAKWQGVCGSCWLCQRGCMACAASYLAARRRVRLAAHHVGHVGHANRVRWPALTVRPCGASKMLRLCAVGHVGTFKSVFQSLYPIL